MNTQKKHKVLLVDNNLNYRKALIKILNEEFDVEVREAANDEEMYKILDSFSADFIIYDLFSGSTKFSATVLQVKLQAPSARLVVLSFEVGEEIIKYCIENGTFGFVDKAKLDMNVFNRLFNGEKVVLGGKTRIHI